MTSSVRPAQGPGLLDSLSLAAHVADELGVRTARDTHLAGVDRVHGALRRSLGGATDLPLAAHHAVAGSVYGGLGLGLRTTGRGLDVAAGVASVLGVEERWNPRLDRGPRGRFVRSTVNGLI